MGKTMREVRRDETAEKKVEMLEKRVKELEKE